MDLWKIADECEIGWLFDPADEHCQADAMTRFANKVSDATAEAIAARIREHLSEPQVMVQTSMGDTERTVACRECELIAITTVA